MTQQTGNSFHGLTLLRHCGGGAFGEVYFCRDLSGRTMAVKIISKNKLGDSWERELRGVTHYRRITEKAPDLLQIHHVEEDGDSFFYTMDAADSSTESGNYTPDTLGERLKKGPIPASALYPILSGIFSGIKTIHAAGFAHRDIKPDNILFVKGQPKLGDIGLVSSLSATMTQLAGTLDFLPPEQRTGNGASSTDRSTRQKSDLYAFGKVVYCAATGQDPRDFPSIPEDLNIPPPVKFFLRLAFRLCDSDPACRTETIGGVESELHEIERKLRRGETSADKLWYLFRMAVLSLLGNLKHTGTFLAQHFLFAGVLSTALIWGTFLFGWLLRDHPNPETARLVALIQAQKEAQKASPGALRQFRFHHGRYSLDVPADWTIRRKEELFSETLPGYLKKQIRLTEAVLIPQRKLYGEKNTSISIFRISRTKTELDRIPDAGLPEALKPYLERRLTGLSTKRLVNPRKGYPMIVAMGKIPPQSTFIAYLFPQKDHCLAVAMTAPGKYKEKDSIKFMLMAQTFVCYDTTPPLNPERRKRQ